MVIVDIDFEMLVDAFQESNLNHIFYLDTKKGELIYYNDLIDEPEDFKEKWDEYEENPRYIGLPTRDAHDDYFIMESFVYTLPNTQLAEQFHSALAQEKPFRKFRHLLQEHPDLQKKWYQYQYNSLKNETINWLYEHNIELSGQQLVPEINIMELNESEIQQLPGDLRNYCTLACLRCATKNLCARWFSCSVQPENKVIEKKIELIMKNEFNVERFNHFLRGKKHYLITAKCPKCGFEHFICDF